MTKKLKTGGEVDSWCTKCKLDLTHRIIAMVGETVKKVECKTCGSHHLYRKPKTLPDENAKKAPVRKASVSASPKPLSAKAERASATERELRSIWESAISGKPASAFQPYRITLTLSVGELVRHSKFGDGVVSRVIDRGKIEVLFQDGARTMAHGQE